MLTHLQRFEAESIQLMREVVAECENPVMLDSIGKDSAIMLHLAVKAFILRSCPSIAACRYDVEIQGDD